MPKLVDAVHSYDIRGTYPDEINDEMFLRLGIALARTYKPRKVAIGRDPRHSSVKLFEAVTRGFMIEGVEVIDLGLIGTEVVPFVAGFYDDIDLAASVTASHLPKQFNGLKIANSDGTPLAKSTGLLEVGVMADDLNLSNIVIPEIVKTSNLNFWPDYRQFIQDKTHLTQITKNHKILVDAGNGVGAELYKHVFGGIPQLETDFLFPDPDPEFPNHVANPILLENNDDIIRELQKGSYDFGVSLDTDADRIVFFNGQGETIYPYYIGLIIGEYLLRTTDKAVVHDNRVRMAWNDLLKQYPDRVIVNKSGRTNFFGTMKTRNAAFSAEISGHFYYEDYFYSDTSMMTLAFILYLMEQGLDINAEFKRLSEKYVISGEVNYEVVEKEAKMAELVAKYSSIPEAVVTEIDGVEVTFPTWAFNVRKSNNEPVLRLNVEADSKEHLIERFKELEAMMDGAHRQNKSLWTELN